MPNTQHELLIVVQGDSTFVSATLLHARLSIETRFNDWIHRRIKEYGFQEGEDFYSNLSKSTGGRKPIDYLLTMDMAKELAMVERNEIGRQIRRYFILKEKELRGVETAVTALAAAPTIESILEGVESFDINGLVVYRYHEVRDRCGYSIKSRLLTSRHLQKFADHFVRINKHLYCDASLAMQLFLQKKAHSGRLLLKRSQSPALATLLKTNLLTKNEGGVI